MEACAHVQRLLACSAGMCSVVCYRAILKAHNWLARNFTELLNPVSPLPQWYLQDIENIFGRGEISLQLAFNEHKSYFQHNVPNLGKVALLIIALHPAKEQIKYQSMVTVQT